MVVAMPLYASESVSPLVIPSDHQLSGWTFDPANLQAGLLMLGGGTLHVARLKVTNATEIASIMFHITLGGITLTSGRNKIGLYSDDGVLLGQCADQATAWSSPGLKVMTLTDPVPVSPWTWYKIAWYTTGLTAPTISRGMNVTSSVLNAGMSGARLRFSTADTGLTTALPATIGTQTAGDVAWWVAVSGS